MKALHDSGNDRESRYETQGAMADVINCDSDQKVLEEHSALSTIDRASRNRFKTSLRRELDSVVIVDSYEVLVGDRVYYKRIV